jgi:gluconolactonase
VPASDYLIEDERFRRLIALNNRIETLYQGTRFAEGPAYFPAGKYLIWSDIPSDRVMRFDETDGSVALFDTKCGHHNGHTVDLEGRLISCEHQGRCVSRIEHNGRRTVLADRFEGGRLNSPNDAVVKSDGSIWFTDPTYGIDNPYEGDGKEPTEQTGNFVFRLDASGELAAVARDFVQPNGLAFSPDESILYVVDTGATHVKDGPRHIRALTMDADGRSITGSRHFADCEVGHFDGIRVDTHGNLWASAGDGIHCYAPDGTRLGKILVPEVVGNLEFGGPKGNRLYICATSSLYAVHVRSHSALCDR